MVVIKSYFTWIIFIIILIDESNEEETKWIGENEEDLFEGDIVGIPQDLVDANHDETQDGESEYKLNRWPNASVPYKISSQFSKLEKILIKLAMREISTKTCVKFVENSVEGSYLNIRQIDSSYPCQSWVGYNSPRHLSLHSGCMTMDEILHELMHALGFYHEHSRFDRNNYITINSENINNWSNETKKYVNRAKNFEIKNHTFVTHMDIEYDFESVLHYKVDAYAKPGSITIVPKTKGVKIKSDGLSRLDILRVNRFYQCQSHLGEIITRNVDEKTNLPSNLNKVDETGYNVKNPNSLDEYLLANGSLQADFQKDQHELFNKFDLDGTCLLVSVCIPIQFVKEDAVSKYFPRCIVVTRCVDTTQDHCHCHATAVLVNVTVQQLKNHGKEHYIRTVVNHTTCTHLEPQQSPTTDLLQKVIIKNPDINISYVNISNCDNVYQCDSDQSQSRDECNKYEIYDNNCCSCVCECDIQFEECSCPKEKRIY